MSEIILDEDIGPHTRVHPNEWDKIFSGRPKFDGTLADLLLNNEATSVFHVDPTQVDFLGTEPEDKENQFVRTILLGVNYHRGHSKGDYKIVVQNIPERKGPYVLIRPPNSNETTFYLQDMTFPYSVEPQFQEDVSTPGKIRKSYLHRGDPLQIFKDFEAKCFTFIDGKMDEAHYDRLVRLVHRANPNYR